MRYRSTAWALILGLLITQSVAAQLGKSASEIQEELARAQHVRSLIEFETELKLWSDLSEEEREATRATVYGSLERARAQTSRQIARQQENKSQRQSQAISNRAAQGQQAASLEALESEREAEKERAYRDPNNQRRVVIVDESRTGAEVDAEVNDVGVSRDGRSGYVDSTGASIRAERGRTIYQEHVDYSKADEKARRIDESYDDARKAEERELANLRREGAQLESALTRAEAYLENAYRLQFTRERNNASRIAQVETLDLALAEGYSPSMSFRFIDMWDGSKPREFTKFTVEDDYAVIIWKAYDEYGANGVFKATVNDANTRKPVHILNDRSLPYDKYLIIESGEYYIRVSTARNVRYEISARSID